MLEARPILVATTLASLFLAFGCSTDSAVDDSTVAGAAAPDLVRPEEGPLDAEGFGDRFSGA